VNNKDTGGEGLKMISRLLEELMQEELSFEQLEESLWKASLKLFQHLMVEVLELFDKKLMENRDKERYENKETNSRTVQTLVGEVSFKRRYYRDREEERWVYLLDEALGIEEEKIISPGLLRLGVTWATKGPSYRDARDRLTDLYGAQVLSHEAIRQALLELGAACERELENRIVKEDGKRTAKVLFIEADGFWTRLQKNRKCKRENQGREVKMVVIHEGWVPRSNSKNSDYRLVNPTYICGLEESYDFWEHVRGVLNANYRDIDKILIVINGDGASWIREGATHFARSMYQYDRFHISRELRSALRFDPEALRKADRALVKDDIGLLSIIATEAMVGCDDMEQKKRLKSFIDLLVANQDYIVDYRVRLKRAEMSVPRDWRGLGASESNVNKFKNRIGKRGRSWSLEGLTAILTTLSRLFEGNLHKVVSRTLEEKDEWMLEHVTSGVGHVVRKTRSDSIGARAGSLPATRNGTKGYSKLFNSLQNVEFA
jgi:hypothetical protein